MSFHVFDDEIRESKQQDNIVVEYLSDEYFNNKYDNSNNIDKHEYTNGFIYNSRTEERDIDFKRIYQNIGAEYPTEERPVEYFTQTDSYKNIRSMPTDYNDRRDIDALIRKGANLNNIYKELDTSGHDKIKWTELSMLEIIKLQGCGAFDRAIDVATNDRLNNQSFFSSRYPLLIFKIRAPCVMFSTEIPTMGRGMNDNSNLTLKHVTNFDKWIVDKTNNGEIRVWYSLQNSPTTKLFINNKLVSAPNVQIRYWHENGLMYITQFNADLIETMPSVVKISHNSIAKNILKIGNLDDIIFETAHRLNNISYNRVVTSYLVYLKDEIDKIIDETINENPRKNEKQLMFEITPKLLNNSFETNDYNEKLTEDEIPDPIIRINIIKTLHIKMSQAFKKAIVLMKKENTLNLTSFDTILNRLPFEIENDINLLTNYFDQLVK